MAATSIDGSTVRSDRQDTLRGDTLRDHNERYA